MYPYVTPYAIEHIRTRDESLADSSGAVRLCGRVGHMYTTTQLAARFQITDQSVKRYSGEFRAFLSPTANPEKGNTRLFTDDDLKVYDVIVRMSKVEHKTFEQIHMALLAGERGEAIDIDATALIPADNPIHLQLMARIQAAETELAKLRTADAQNQLLLKMISDKDAEIARLNREIGALLAGRD